jgi:hypothetical protein
MTVKEILEIVGRKRDGDPVRAAAAVADFCRFRLGLNYRQTFEIVQRVLPDMSMPEWDALLYEADWEGP